MTPQSGRSRGSPTQSVLDPPVNPTFGPPLGGRSWLKACPITASEQRIPRGSATVREILACPPTGLDQRIGTFTHPASASPAAPASISAKACTPSSRRAPSTPPRPDTPRPHQGPIADLPAPRRETRGGLPREPPTPDPGDNPGARQHGQIHPCPFRPQPLRQSPLVAGVRGVMDARECSCGAYPGAYLDPPSERAHPRTRAPLRHERAIRTSRDLPRPSRADIPVTFGRGRALPNSDRSPNAHCSTRRSRRDRPTRRPSPASRR